MKIVPKRKLHYPFAIECDYAKLLVGYVRDCMAAVRSYIPEMRKLVAEQSAPGATSVNVYLALLIDRIRHDMPQVEGLEGRMRRVFDDVAHFTWRDLRRVIESATGTRLPSTDVHLPRRDADDDLDALKEIWVGENLDLIRSIDDETMRRIRQALTARITGSVNHAGLAKDLIAEIQAITEKEKSRAELIARDQLGKLHGQINRRKQESLGIDEYEWETSHDERVRDSHRALQGKVFSWNKPPPEGHPGYPIRCRCIALPVIDWDRQLGEPEKGSYKDVPDVAPQEEAAIMRYIGGEAYLLNEKLRDGISLTPNEKLWVSSLDSALKKMPRYSGTAQRSLTFYSEEELQAFLVEHEINTVVSYPAYTSMTASEEVYNPHGQVQIFVIQSSQGRDIRRYNSDEQEVLYFRNSRFKVKAIKRVGGQYYIYLEEMPDE